MPDPSHLRDSTQIVLPRVELAGLREELEARFTVTVFNDDEGLVRIIGSPVEIKGANGFLARRGVSVP